MKKNLLTKILACSMALAMFTGAGMTVSAVETELGGLSHIISEKSDANEEYTERLEAFQHEARGLEFLENDEYYYWLNEDGTVETMFCKLQTKNVTVPSEIDGKPVTSIGCFTFYKYKSLETVTLPDTVKTLRGGFEDSGIREITIPKSVTAINMQTFSMCENLKNIYVDSENPIYSSLDGLLTNKEQNKLIVVPNGREGSFTVPEKIDSLQRWESFRFCSKLTDITLSDKIKVISIQAFDSCTKLKSVRIADGLEKIETFAFYNCTSLKKVYIPSSVSEIDYTAFINCSELTIYGEKGSYAETFAKEKNIPFETALFNKSVVSADKIVFGQTVTVTARASETDCTYAVLYKKTSDKKWTVKQNYSTNQTITIKPAKATDYQICVKVKDSTGNIVKKFFNLSVTPWSNTSKISQNSITLGQTVTVYASTDDNSNPFTYAVLYKKNSDTKWTVKQNYSENAVITIKPAKATDYRICVKTKDSTGKIVKKFFDLTVKDKLRNTSTVSADTVKYGSQFKINASATGGEGGYAYSVFYKKQNETEWTAEQGYTSDTIIYMTLPEKGDYNICVKVKDKAGNISNKRLNVKAV